MLNRFRVVAAILAALGAVLLTACGGREDPSTPIACQDGARVYVQAVTRGEESPPRLADGTPVSDCLVRGQQGGPLAEVGGAMLAATRTLNRQARANPGGAANLALGRLLGAAEAGAAETGGIHADLIRNLGAAARYSPGGKRLTPAFEETLETGVASGQS